MLQGLRKNNLFLLILLLLLSQQAQAQQDTSLTFSEIMFYGASGNNEFIELFNLSYTRTIDLSGYKMKYATSNSDIIISLLRGSLLKPRSYAVIFEGDYDTLGGIYSQLVPDSVLIMRIGDNSFGTSGMANTSDRMLILLSPADDTLDIYTYTANNQPQRSDEKISLTKDNSAENWGNSSVINGTPGFRNSIMPYTIDLAAAGLTCSPLPLPSGTHGELRFSAVNKGINTALNFTLALYLDANNDSVPQPSELITSQNFSNLTQGDSVQIYHTYFFATAEPYRFIARAEISNDEFPQNNSIYTTITPVSPQYSFNELIINEIMYAPSSPEKEWIEIYNRSGRTINLKKWRIADRTSETALTTSDYFLAPQQFAVISDDSTLLNLYQQPIALLTGSLPSLNNDGDRILLKDSLGLIIDSVTYFTQWGGLNGRSLERIYYDSASSVPGNWKSTEGIYNGTPGLKNSVIPKFFDLALSSFGAAQGYAVIGEDALFTALIKNKGLSSSQSSTLEIYHDISLDSIPGSGELIYSLPIISLAANDSLLISFTVNLTTSGLQRFIARINYPDDENTLNNQRYTSLKFAAPYTNRGQVIINEIMYAPPSEQPEWIEIYNQSTTPVLLNGFMIADEQDTSHIFTSSVLMPESFLVISRDSSISSLYTHSFTAITAGFPPLNNSGDKIVLLDSLGKITDSLRYSPDWGGTDGLSLERVSYLNSSTDSVNWQSAALRRKATPGLINSVSQKNFDLRIDSLHITPQFPVTGDTINATIYATNSGRIALSGDILFYNDSNNDSLPDNLLQTITAGLFTPGQQKTFSAAGLLKGVISTNTVYATISAPADEDTSNNYEYIVISPGVPPGTIAINEIMYQPADDEPEWIELFNNSNDTLSLSGWKIRDVFTTPASVTLKENAIILPNSFLVLSKDSSIYEYHQVIPSPVITLSLPTLNNNQDGVSLTDDRGVIIDSVVYSGAANGKSLERISSTGNSLAAENWLFSSDRKNSSPGRLNSVSPRQHDLAITAVNLFTKFPTAGDSLSFLVTIANRGVAHISETVLYTHWSDGTNSGGDTLSVNFPSLSDSLSVLLSNSAHLGLTPLSFSVTIPQADDDIWNNNFTIEVHPGQKEKSIIITELMIIPSEVEPEWVEIYNNSDSAISLDGWQISDYSPTLSKRSISGNYYLAPGEYGIICSDSSLSVYPWLKSNNHIVIPLPALGNTGDGVFLFDRAGSIIDSVIYTSSWDLEKWYTLERKDISGYSGDKENWYASAIYGGTPGQINYATQQFPSADTKLMINEIMAYPTSGMPEYIEFFNAGDSLIRLNYISVNGKRMHRGMQIAPGDYFVISADSSFFSFYPNLIWPLKASIISSLRLRNEMDTIMVSVMNGKTLDSVVYTKDWHSKNSRNFSGLSLEKVNPVLISNAPENWSTSVSPSGGTPGLPNSIYTELTGRASGITISPNPFSPDEDGHEDFTLVHYALPYQAANLTVYIYDKNGRKVRTLKELESNNGTGEFAFDGKDDSGNPLRIGIYILYLEAIDHKTRNNSIHKSAFVIARKL